MENLIYNWNFGIFLLVIIFIIPSIRQLGEILKNLLVGLNKQNEMIASIHDKVMDIRNFIEESSRKK